MTGSVMQVLEAAVAQHQAGRLAEAERLYRAVLQQAPQQPDALNLLGIIAAQQGDLNQAISLFDQAIAAAPQLATVPFNKANTLRDAGRSEEARAAYEAALDVDPNFHDARLNLGVLLQQNDDTEDALRHFNILARLDPKSHPIAQKVHYNIGKCRHSQGRLEEAATALEKALALNPNDPDAHFAIANVHADLRDHQKAVTHINAAIKLKPDWPEAYSVLGLMLSRSEQFEAAIAAGKKAAELDPKSGSIHLNLALVCNAAGETAEAEAALEQAFDVEPENTEFRHHLSRFFLLAGDLQRGWRDFDLRFMESELTRQYQKPEPPPYWSGEDIEDLRGKKLLIWTEQGLGEQILATTVMPDLIRTGTDFAVECSPRLAPVLRDAFPEISVTNWMDHAATVREADPPFDFQYPALSLMKTFRPTTDSAATPPSRIRPNRGLLKHLRSRYEQLADGRKIIGLSWRSSNPKIGPSKSIPLADLEPILRTDNVLFVNLQYGDCGSEIQAVNQKLGVDIFLDSEIDPSGDLGPVLTQIAAMDLSITVSNTNAHFAGSLNVPAWVMIPVGRSLHWFWFKDRLSSPWYPSLRLFRQTAGSPSDDTNWPEVIEQVAAALPEWLSQSENTPQSSSIPS